MSGSAYEARLVDRFRHGDPEALSALFDMHVDGVYAYARHVLGNREDAEEVTSEAFLRAFRGAAEFRSDAPFKAWIFRIALNLCRDRRRQPRLLTVPVRDTDPCADRDPQTVIVDMDVRAAVESLPEEYQDVLLLCDAQEWDAREAAAILGKSREATKSLLYRARRALRDRLREMWEEE